MPVGTFSVEITNNMQDFTTSGVVYFIQQTISLSEVADVGITPVGGPVEGGTTITVTPTEPSRDSMCAKSPSPLTRKSYTKAHSPRPTCPSTIEPVTLASSEQRAARQQ